MDTNYGNASNQRTIRVAGRGRDDNNFTYDGIDATNIINQAQQPYVRLATPLDTIEEFRVVSMLATAQTGATAGAQTSVTSPSGTNRFHGDAFYFVRNDVFDAKTFIEERQAQPRRLNDSARVCLILWSRLCDWREALVIVISSTSSNPTITASFCQTTSYI